MTTPCGYQQLTGLSGVKSLTVPASGAVPSGSQAPKYCVIIPESQAVRWRDDGVAPTASVGYPLAVGAELTYDGDLKKIQFIEQVASSTINIQYYY